MLNSFSLFHAACVRTSVSGEHLIEGGSVFGAAVPTLLSREGGSCHEECLMFGVASLCVRVLECVCFKALFVSDVHLCIRLCTSMYVCSHAGLCSTEILTPGDQPVHYSS